MSDTYLQRWSLVLDGDSMSKHSSQLLSVVQNGVNAMLKLSKDRDERASGIVMEWWNGDGAARVIAHENSALLVERTTGPASLSAMARSGQDDEACRILCAAAARLHATRTKPQPDLVPFAHWFRALEPIARTHDGILSRCDTAAKAPLPR